MKKIHFKDPNKKNFTVCGKPLFAWSLQTDVTEHKDRVTCKLCNGGITWRDVKRVKI